MVYERQIATATRLITKYGQLCTWREPGTPGGTPARPVDGVPDDYPVPIVFLSNANQGGLATILSMLRDMDIPTGGVRGLMPAVPFTPTLKGRVSRAPTFTEPALSIIDDKGIDVLNVNGEIILYYLRFSR